MDEIMDDLMVESMDNLFLFQRRQFSCNKLPAKKGNGQVAKIDSQIKDSQIKSLLLFLAMRLLVS